MGGVKVYQIERGGLKFTFLDKPGEMFERTVIGPFRISGKTAAGELATFQMITDAVTAEPFPRAGIISAQAVLQIFILFALHALLLSFRSFYPEKQPPCCPVELNSFKTLKK